MFFTILIVRRWVEWGGGNCRNLVGIVLRPLWQSEQWGIYLWYRIFGNFHSFSKEQLQNQEFSRRGREGRGGGERGYYERNLVQAAWYLHKRPDFEYLASRDHITKGKIFSVNVQKQFLSSFQFNMQVNEKIGEISNKFIKSELQKIEHIEYYVIYSLVLCKQYFITICLGFNQYLLKI